MTYEEVLLDLKDAIYLDKENVFEFTVIDVGDLVVLRSGGPVMTVTAVCDDCDTVSCGWFDNNIYREGIFPEASLDYV